MARVRLIHFNGPEGREGRLRLAAMGHQADLDVVEGPGLMKKLRVNMPDAYIIDLSRLPSGGRQVGMALRATKATRDVPIVFVDGEPAKVKALKQILPDATYTTWSKLKDVLPRAIATQPATPVVPPSSIYSGKPAVEKIGIKAGMTVSLLGAPPGFAAALKPLPAGVKLSAKPDASADLFLCVVRTLRELHTHLITLARIVERQPLWIVWPKQGARIKSEVTGNVVRETGLASGWVDYKVCAVDETWSGLAFKRRR
jgi:hypothetical protein